VSIRSGAIPLNESHESAFDLACKELDFRREKQWNIFSWCSTTLVAITGGAIALQTGPQPHPLFRSQRAIISLAVVILVAYAIVWLGHNWHMEKLARRCFSDDVSEQVWGPKRKVVGYRWALAMLGAAALLAIWYPS
jgi:hypothetical protein